MFDVHDWAEARRLHRQGLSKTAIANRLGMSCNTASTLVASLGGLVNADAVHAECAADGSGFGSTTTITNLTIAGAPVFPGGVFTPNPNTVVSLPLVGVTITLNEVVDKTAPPASSRIGARSPPATSTPYTSAVPECSATLTSS